MIWDKPYHLSGLSGHICKMGLTMAVLLAPQSGNPMRGVCESNREGLQTFKALLLSFSSAPLSEDSAHGVNYTVLNYSFVPLEAE